MIFFEAVTSVSQSGVTLEVTAKRLTSITHKEMKKYTLCKSNMMFVCFLFGQRYKVRRTTALILSLFLIYKNEQHLF